MRALIDTCIVIDALQNRSPFANDARAIFYAAADNRFDGYVTAKSTADIYYLMHRYTHSDKETRDVLRRLGSLFEFLDTSAADCINAIDSNIRDYEDAIMSESAERSGMDCIVTRNTADYLFSKVAVYTPHEFLAMFD